VNEHGGNNEARLSPDHRTLYFSTNTVPPRTIRVLKSRSNGTFCRSERGPTVARIFGLCLWTVGSGRRRPNA